MKTTQLFYIYACLTTAHKQEAGLVWYQGLKEQQAQILRDRALPILLLVAQLLMNGTEYLERTVPRRMGMAAAAQRRYLSPPSHPRDFCFWNFCC